MFSSVVVYCVFVAQSFHAPPMLVAVPGRVRVTLGFLASCHGMLAPKRTMAAALVLSSPIFGVS